MIDADIDVKCYKHIDMHKADCHLDDCGRNLGSRHKLLDNDDNLISKTVFWKQNVYSPTNIHIITYGHTPLFL